MVGIIARLPYALAGEFVTRFEQAGGGLLESQNQTAQKKYIK